MQTDFIEEKRRRHFNHRAHQFRLAFLNSVRVGLAYLISAFAFAHGSANSDDSASAIAVDSVGNVYVSGGSFKSGDSYQTVVTVKYDPNGQQLWASRYNGSPSSPPFGSRIALDNAGSVYATAITRLG